MLPLPEAIYVLWWHRLPWVPEWHQFATKGGILWQFASEKSSWKVMITWNASGMLFVTEPSLCQVVFRDRREITSRHLPQVQVTLQDVYDVDVSFASYAYDAFLKTVEFNLIVVMRKKSFLSCQKKFSERICNQAYIAAHLDSFNLENTPSKYIFIYILIFFILLQCVITCPWEILQN